ncbi:early growth response protein 1-like [Frieseomelitta varia]|uniref:early growth response protein 1-like n=1 Tax=Frieseomelitta varia TaxID=561572 RepID=UPI001CB69E20|nr:early growth response protein 1-like [Frieseomelitta varia]
MYNKGDVRLFRPWSVSEPVSEPEDFDAEHDVAKRFERSFVNQGNTNFRNSNSDSNDEIISINNTDRSASSVTTHNGHRQHKRASRQSSVEAGIERSRATKDQEPTSARNRDSELFPRLGGSYRSIPPSTLSIPLITGFVVDNDGSVVHSTYQQDCLLGLNVPQCVFHSSMMDRVLNRVASTPGQSSVTSMPHSLYTPMVMEQAVEMLHRQDAVAKQLKKQRPKKFRCEHCDVAFSNNGQLKGHVRIHTGERPFKCDFEGCGKTFTRNEELTRHKRIHTGIRPHACFVCGKRFGRKDHLKKHMRTHENRDPYRLSATTLGIFGQHPFSPYNFQM